MEEITQQDFRSKITQMVQDGMITRPGTHKQVSWLSTLRAGRVAALDLLVGANEARLG